MKKFFILFFLLSVFCLLMLSCASNWTKNNGSSAQDDDIKIIFETYDYVPDYNYFYTRYANDPEAIVGIKKDYELVKVSGWVAVTNWQQFEPGGEKLKELVEAMRIPGRPYGYIINEPGGDQIGVMYTTRWGGYRSEIRLKDGNQLEVTPHKYNSTFAPSQ